METKKVKIAFVILNFETYEETKECIESIRTHIDVKEYKIIVVDNASTDDSLKQLTLFCGESKDVDIIPNERNLGYAKGNNVGIRHAIKTYSPAFLVVNNSDTEIFQDDLYKKLSIEYEHSHFALLGPMMILLNGRCDDSPWEPTTIKEVEHRLKEKKQEKARLDSRFFYLYRAVYKMRKMLGFKKEDNDRYHRHKDFWRYQTQVELQGAFLVFSKEAFNYINGFDERTFLYYEEQLLYLSLIKHRQTIVYDPRIAIFHKELRATRKAKSSKIEKMRFINKCNIESLEVLYETMREMQEER